MTSSGAETVNKFNSVFSANEYRLPIPNVILVRLYKLIKLQSVLELNLNYLRAGIFIIDQLDFFFLQHIT